MPLVFFEDSCIDWCELQPVLDSVSGSCVGSEDEFKDSFASPMDFFNQIFSQLGDLFANIGNFFVEFPQMITDAVGDIGQVILDEVTAVFEPIFESVQAIADALAVFNPTSWFSVRDLTWVWRPHHTMNARSAEDLTLIAGEGREEAFVDANYQFTHVWMTFRTEALLTLYIDSVGWKCLENRPRTFDYLPEEWAELTREQVQAVGDSFGGGWEDIKLMTQIGRVLTGVQWQSAEAMADKVADPDDLWCWRTKEEYLAMTEEEYMEKNRAFGGSGGPGDTIDFLEEAAWWNLGVKHPSALGVIEWPAQSGHLW